MRTDTATRPILMAVPKMPATCFIHCPKPFCTHRVSATNVGQALRAIAAHLLFAHPVGPWTDETPAA